MTSDGFYDNIPPEPKKRLRYTCSLWKRTGFGFGFGIWRVMYSETEIIWTLAIGPLSIYLRYA